MSRSFLPLAAAASLLFPSDAASAQDRPIPVYFEACNDQQLNDAIAVALTQPPFLLLTKRTPSALMITIPDQVIVDHKTSGTSWTFTVAFSRDGDSLGQSVESCGESKLTDCTDQLVSDVKSAAGAGP